ncbi:hypothetical protein PENSPDRAFT_733519 [Peniophora sp. CONT]|nr:hypothetical protein PENSPDRAFT_733519 [Peniophora sp. CONT]
MSVWDKTEGRGRVAIQVPEPLTVKNAGFEAEALYERLSRVFSDPTGSMHAFRALYRESMVLDSPLSIEASVLSLGKDIKDCFPIVGERAFAQDRCMVLYAGFESGFLLFLREAIQENTCLQQSEDTCVLVLELLFAFINSFNIRAPPGMDAVKARRLHDEILDTLLDKPWTGLLLNRKLIRRTTAGVDRQVSALTMPAMILVDLYYFRGRVKEVYGSPLAQLLLYLWLSAPSNVGDMPGAALRSLTKGKREQKSIHTSPSFLDKGLGMFGAQYIMSVIRREVDRAVAQGWGVYEEHLIHIMHAFRTARPQCLLALTKVPLIESLVKGAIKIWYSKDYRSVTFWVAAPDIIRRAEDTARAGVQQAPSSTLITPPDVIPPFMALGVLLWAYPPVAEVVMGQFDTKLHLTIPDCLSYMFSLHSERMRTSNHLDYYRRAREATEPIAYYTVLEALHQTLCRSRSNLDMQTVAWLTMSWQKWGVNVGIDEKSAHAAWSKTRDRRCEWVQCRFHVQLAPSTLRECKGCGNARYCSKDCQGT